MDMIIIASFIIGLLIVIVSGLIIKYGIKNGLFDEDVKYLVFDEKDKDKMTAEEFEKAMAVNKKQELLREESLKSSKPEKIN